MSAPAGTQVPPRGRPERRFSDEFHRLRGLALEWIGPYYDGEHLARAGDWLLELDPSVSEPLIIAVLTHDMERAMPGSIELNKRTTAWDDPVYIRRHCERSAEVVATWLREHDAPDEFVDGIRLPILEHELGGSPDGDLAQAADSLSWLNVNARLAAEWVSRGECDLAKAAAKLRWMRERIRLPRAAELAEALYGPALDELRAAGQGPSTPPAR